MNVTNVDEIIARNKLLEEENAKLKEELDGKIIQIYLQKKLCNDWKYIVLNFECPIQINVFDDGNEKYKELARHEKDVHFLGRLATYKYFNMDEAILNALEYFDKNFE